MGCPKIIVNFFKIAKGCKFDAECDWYSKIQQNVQSLGFFKNRWVLPKLNLEFFKRTLQAAKSPLNAPELIKFNKTFTVWAFQRKQWVLPGNRNFSDTAKGSKYAVECDCLLKMLEIWVFLSKNRCIFFQKKSWIFLIWLKVAKLP